MLFFGNIVMPDAQAAQAAAQADVQKNEAIRHAVFRKHRQGIKLWPLQIANFRKL
jgi:hypothetical protein